MSKIKTKKKNPADKKKEDFFDRVFKIVAQIPKGKVTTYGAIAEVCGIKSSARTVGWAVSSAKLSNLPCHRVVNRVGALTGKMHFATPTLMEDLLRSELVEFDKNGCVNMKKHFWMPKKSPQKSPRATRGERRS
ncbi:MAG: methylated-DNA--[protein]-cysteine S-methyltransferase [bacterium]